ncbi:MULTISPECIES: sensor histidine kinase KdpD [Nostoc]|uniref:histidine kinase n=1 Tax=Nostoc paludosum FACHB-159 TaxID=2692908 RepID=A0ABR8KMZ4_9NOSO|nr:MULTISPECIES: HAMP domain-containing sensor histidine kinase [Nostoc]MBD2683639.1 HAMP domain-containing histidine kinase [Nostoc sp. FACHB-857]MBD2739968.1 HAMP domain-containing histidine kinase [Nostoc paludosum FACHB-159]
MRRLINHISSKNQPNTVIFSSEFLAWRQQFIPSRIRLLAWVVFIVLVMVTIFHITITIPSLNASGDPKLIFDAKRMREYLEVAVTQILSVGIGLLLAKSRVFQKSPERMFLLLSGLVLMPSQIIATLRGQASFDGDMWILFYAIQAILIPVHWRSHLISQVTVIGYFAIAMLLGWRDPNVIVPAAYGLGIFYTILICLVADVGVFLYERSLQREFELRQQLRVFLHAVSHDLRNPVIGMVMTLKTFWHPEQHTAQIPQELLKHIIDSGDRQVALINSLLEAHETEVHGIVLHHQRVKLHDLVKSVITDLQPFIQQANATVTYTIPTDLPPVNADALHLRRVYENLLLNALRYNRPGVNLTLDAVVGEHLNNQIRCTVQDDGVGMTQQQCDRLFELYSRGPNNRQSLGLGLGLYICRQIITAHGGKIGAISSPGNGATFWFTLPI